VQWKTPREAQADLLNQFQRSTDERKSVRSQSQYIGAVSACTYRRCQVYWIRVDVQRTLEPEGRPGNPYVTHETPATKPQVSEERRWSQFINDPEKHHGSGPATKAKESSGGKGDLRPTRLASTLVRTIYDKLGAHLRESAHVNDCGMKATSNQKKPRRYIEGHERSWSTNEKFTPRPNVNHWSHR